MKRRLSIFIALVMMIFAVIGCFCGCEVTPINPTDPGDSRPSDEDPPDETDPSDTTTDRVVYLKVSNGGDTVYTLKKQASAKTVEIYSVKVELVVGDKVTVYDNSDNTFDNYGSGDFDGTAERAGRHTFELRIEGETHSITVTVPQASEPNPDENDPEPETPRSTKTTVYYTDNEGWGTVYAYVWNNATEAHPVEWPGKRLTSIGANNYNQKQYSIEVDYSVYDRIIFNNGSNSESNKKQTKNLVVSGATSGYFGRDEVFTMGTDNYGKVEYFTVKDAKNLNYLPTSSKKISVYTPSNYSKSKKYGVLYMFDSQNLYCAADGAQESHDDYGSWAVDVAVTSLVKNGGDGVIIVAIDNTDGHRDSELTMSQSFGTLTSLADESGFYNGKLDELGNFIKETLMPWVAARYSVDTSPAKTGIAGSSSGGLAAYYLGLRDNDLYGYIGAFSPANGLFGQSDWTKFYRSKNNFASGKPKIYVYCGEKDKGLEDMLLPATKQIKSLTSYGYKSSDITEYYLEGATHSENYWRLAFAEFLGKYF